ncbi:kelch motif family protein, partial [Chrysochromulina tobinii]
MIKRNRGVHERLRGNPGCSTGSEHVQCAVASLPSVSTHAALPIFRLVTMHTSFPFHRRCLRRRGFDPPIRKRSVDTLGMLRALTGSMPLATLASSSTDGRDLLRWTDAASGKMSDLPHARGGAAVARWELASQQLLYMYGGCSIVQCYDGLMRLDLYRGKWTTEQVKGTPPKKRKGHTLNLLGRSLDEQVLLVIGGWSGDGVVPNGIKEYSIIHNQWQYRAFQGTPPPDRWAHTATSIDPEHVIVFGGEGTTPGQYLNDVYLFSLLEGEWRRLHPQGDERFGAERLLPAGRMGHTATLIKTPTSHALYIFGGYTTAARGTRQHRVATNELWALDLRGGLGEQQRDSPGSDYLRWVKTELQCYDDAFMLDTTYPQGHYWQKLPVGMQRPAARQMLTAWVHGASLVVSGGCTPAQDAAQDHCYSDVWQLPLDGLIQGGKQLNATGRIVGAESLLATEEDDDAVPLYIDTSLNDGVDVLSAAVIYGTNTFEDAMCQMSNITRCPFTYVTRGHAAKEETLELEDTTKFTIGRILRINPGAPNQEDNQIVGFGERVLSETQKRLLALAAARHAADSAIEHKEPTLAHKLEES